MECTKSEFIIQIIIVCTNAKVESQPDHTIKLSVKSGDQKPYLYKSKAYKRNDTATYTEYTKIVNKAVKA